MTDEITRYINRTTEFIQSLLDKITDLEKENAELKEKLKEKNSLLGDIIEAFTSQSLTDDYEMACTAREIAEILEMKNYR